MKYCVPESDTSSIHSSQTFYSLSDPPQTPIHPSSMTSAAQNTHNTSIAGATPRDLLSTLPQNEIEELFRIHEERSAKLLRTQQVPEVAATSTKLSLGPSRRDTNLPKWNGKLDDFGLYMRRLELRVERELSPFVDPCSICLDMIDTLSETKQARVAEWFQESERNGTFNWRELAFFFRKQFEDKQARQTAASMLSRMEQGYHHFFDNFPRDFEYRVAQSGGSEAHTNLGKIQKLKDAVNV